MFALGLILTTMSIWTPSVRIEGRQAEGFVGIRDGDRLARVVLEDRERGELAQGEIGPGDPRWDLPPWAVVPTNSQFAADEVFLAKVRIPKDSSYWRLRYETASGRRGFSPWVDECGEIETEAWQRRIDAAHAAGGGVVEVPAGRHRTGGLFLKSNVELRLAKGAVLEGVADIGHYRGMKLPYVEVDEPWTAVIGAQGATNVAVTGEGVICGNGGLYRFNLIGSRPRGIILYRCRDVRLENFTIRDPASWSCYLKECDGVRVKGLRIDSHANMNNDGLDIESCNVSVEGCDIDSGDDGICLKSDNPNYLVTNVVVRDCVVRTPCTALKLGTASHGGFKDIRFEHCRVARARRAIRMPCADAAFWGVERMKSYPGYVYEGGATPPVPGIGIENVDGGSFAGIRFSDIDIEETLVPLFVRMGERRKRSFESSQIAIPFGAHPSLEDVRIENVTARSVAATASAITGVPGFRPQNIVLRNVSCRIKGGGAASEASRPVPEKAGAYPDPNMFDCQILPAYGLYVRHADGIRLENVRFVCDNPQEGRPERVTDDAEVSAVPAWPRERLFQVPRTYPSETFRTNDDIPAEATAWYFNVCSSNGFVRSTPVRTRMRFQSACPVWPQGAEKEMNTFFRFRGEFESAPGAKALLRITAGYDYKAWLDGAFVAFGPARTAPGFFRVDEWPLKPAPGANVLEIDVAGYNCNNFYLPDQTPFLQAEVVVDGRVVARTAADGNLRAFTTGRRQKVPRFSYQRTFAEIYRLPHAAKEIPALAEQPAKKLLPREWDVPDFKVTEGFEPQSLERVVWDRSICPKSDRYIVSQQANYKHFKVEELEENPYYDIQRLKTAARTAAPAAEGGWHPLADGEGLVFAGEFEAAGFPLLKVRCAKPVTIYLTFDELLQADGSVDPFRAETLGTLVWHLAPGEHELEGFEPVALKAARILAVGGAADVTAPRVRTYASPLADRASFRSSDPALEKIFDAARRSYAANAVDCLADCPIRERAGWLGDTFFTGRASKWLTGSAKNEGLFLRNFLLQEKFDGPRGDLPFSIDRYEGLVPAVWPVDLMDHACFIPNYDFWFVLELEEFMARGGDPALVQAFRPKVMEIVGWFDRHLNSDGLLEKLQGWVFVEWSKANDLVQDVSYPSNMMYAKMLDAIARLYAMPDLAMRAAKIRETVRRQSLTADGWYCDNAVRQKDGALKLSGERTEICQYYAFFTGVADKERDALLWTRLVEDFGPERIRKGVWKEIWPANFIFGTCLRLELLSRDGRGAQIYREIRDYFLQMAEKTGTLWEHNDPRASCCHGFASIASEYLIRDILGVRRIDGTAKTICVAPSADIPLAWCEGTIPVSPEAVAVVKWRKSNGKPVVEVELPTTRDTTGDNRNTR